MFRDLTTSQPILKTNSLHVKAKMSYFTDTNRILLRVEGKENVKPVFYQRKELSIK